MQLQSSSACWEPWEDGRQLSTSLTDVPNSARPRQRQGRLRRQKEVQDVYQQLIADVKADREEQRTYINELKEDRNHLRAERNELRDRIDATDEKVRELQKEVARNCRMVESLRPFLCGVLGCKHRKLVTISGEGGIEPEQDIDPIENSVL